MLDLAQAKDLRLIELQDYLEAVIEASRRTRFVVITATIASVLILAGLVNSLKHQWMLERLWALSNPDISYVESKIGAPPAAARFPPNRHPRNAAMPSLDMATQLYAKAYNSFYDAMAKTYVDSLVTKVPIFGFGIDANDLGMIGGFAFVVILLMYRFSLGREMDNLKIARTEAQRAGQSREFYLVLAMHQVFTIPQTPRRTRKRLLVWAPQLICLLPLLVQALVTGHDALTFDVADKISRSHNTLTIVAEGLALAALLYLSVAVFVRIGRLDRIWDAWWTAIHETDTASGAVSPSP
jgi:hypothetical protein